MKTNEQVDARKERYGQQQAIELLEGMHQLVVAKGKKITEVDLKRDRPDDETLAGMLLGPTGNLRAPTIKVGKTILVGFNEDAYSEQFG